jgi:hypothetical protein
MKALTDFKQMSKVNDKIIWNLYPRRKRVIVLVLQLMVDSTLKYCGNVKKIKRVES